MSTNPVQIGPYLLGQRLGRNSRHQVYAAVHQTTQAEVAVKLVNITSKVDRDFAIKRMAIEARILKRLDHPNLVRILDADIVDNTLYFVMEKVDAEPLSTILGRRGKLAWDLAVDYARQIAEALDYLHHQDLLHLKVTPDKILVSADGKIKLTDMRVNRARKRRWDDSRSRVLDTAAYLAPEFLAGEDVTAKCDMYSLGVILFEMITGKLPFEPDTMGRLIQRKKHLTPPALSSIELEVPVWIDRLVSQLIAGDPQRRLHTMHAAVLSLIEAQKMDASKMGVAQRVAKGFNPLSIGRDPEEARQLLGQKKHKESKPIDYSIPLLVGGLLLVVLLIGAGIGWSLIPPSQETLIARARELVTADEAVSLSEAKTDYLLPLLERFPTGPYAAEAQALLDVTETKLAGRKLRLNYKLDRAPRSDAERLCLAAWLREEDSDWSAAWRLYYDASQTIDPDGEDRGYQMYAAEQAAAMAVMIAAEPNAEEIVRTEYEAAVTAFEEGDIEKARKALTELIAIYGPAESLSEVMTTVKAGLEALPKPDAPTSEETANEETTNDETTTDPENNPGNETTPTDSEPANDSDPRTEPNTPPQSREDSQR